jgi:hypothetical protein
MIAKASLLETDGREGIEILKDEPFQNELGKGNFTYRVFHLTRHHIITFHIEFRTTLRVFDVLFNV